MPISPDLSHLPAEMNFSLGPTAGLWEGAAAAWQQQRIVDSAMGFEQDLRMAYGKSIEAMQKYQPDSPLLKGGADWLGALAMGAAARRAIGLDPHQSLLPPGVIDKYLETIDKTDAEITKLRDVARREIGVDLPIKTFKEVLADEERKRKEVLQEYATTQGREHFMGHVGSFFGSIAGSFDPTRDPLLFFSFLIPVGGPEAALGRKLLLEALVGGGTEAAQQALFVQPRAKALGEPATNPLESILFVALGAAAFRGVAEGLPRSYRALEAKVAPERAAARIISSTIEESLGRPLDYSVLRLSDRELLDAVRSLPRTTERAAAEAGLSARVTTDEISPYPATREGRLQTDVELAQAAAQFEGFTSTETAVGRFLPEDSFRPIAETPQEIFARAENPELFRAIEDTQTQVDALQARLTKQEEALGSRPVSDAVSLVDTKEGEAVRQIEQQLAEGKLRKPTREKLERQLDVIVDRVGPKKIEQAAQKLRAAQKREIRLTRDTLRPLQRDLKRFQTQAQRLGTRKLEQSRTEARVLGKGQVSDTVRATEAAAEAAEAVKEPSPPPPTSPEGGEVYSRTSVQIGNQTYQFENGRLVGDQTSLDVMGTSVRRSLEIPRGEDVGGGTRTAEEVLQEIADDEAVLRFAKDCGIE